ALELAISIIQRLVKLLNRVIPLVELQAQTLDLTIASVEFGPSALELAISLVYLAIQGGFRVAHFIDHPPPRVGTGSTLLPKAVVGHHLEPNDIRIVAIQ